MAAKAKREISPADHRVDDLNTRARLLRAATECFAEHGYEGTSTREIADRANVAQQLITYHFGSKERLWRAVVDTLHQEFLCTMDGLQFDESGDLLEQFRRHQRVVLNDRIRRPHMARIWTQEFLSGGERFNETLVPILRDFAETVSGPYFREVVRLGIAKGYTASETTLICNAVLQLNVLNPFFVEGALGKPSGSAASVEQQVELLVRILAAGAADAGAIDAASEHAPRAEAEPARPSRGGRSERSAPATGDDVRELKQIIAELTVENRRLRRRLQGAGGAAAPEA